MKSFILKILIVLFSLGFVVSCAAKSGPAPAVEPAVVADDSQVLKCDIDPGDVIDHGPVNFLIIYGDTAQHYFDEWAGKNLRLIRPKGEEAILVYLSVHERAPAGDEVVYKGVYDFKIVSGPSAIRALKVLDAVGSFLYLSDSAKTIYLLVGPETKTI